MWFGLSALPPRQQRLRNSKLRQFGFQPIYGVLINRYNPDDKISNNCLLLLTLLVLKSRFIIVHSDK